jgi:DNA-binding IscR family transcriptional regulator
MAHSGRFSLSLRILGVLAAAPSEMHTSAAIAEALSESAVVIRRLFPLLERGGLIEQRRGPKGGARLKVAAQEIGVGDIYLAAEGDWLAFGDPRIATMLKQASKYGVLAMNETTLAHLLKRMGKKPTQTSQAIRGPAKFRVETITVSSKRGGVDGYQTQRPLVSGSDTQSHSYRWQ